MSTLHRSFAQHHPTITTSLGATDCCAQVALNRSGRVEEIVCETRLWDEVKLVTYAMRRKEGLADYRYFPEPDLPPLVLSEEMIEEVRVGPTHTGIICED